MNASAEPVFAACVYAEVSAGGNGRWAR